MFSLQRICLRERLNYFAAEQWGKIYAKLREGEIPIDVLKHAANAMRADKSGRSAAKQFGIDQTTFRQYLKQASKGLSDPVKIRYAKHRKIFTDKMEKDLA